jgi:cytochrome c oxidase assembly protein subunit 15
MGKDKVVFYWLVIGIVLIFFQVIIGGITRITGSGLSITKWEIVTGTLPPFSEDQWNNEFDLYKLTPQYDLLNKGMSLSDFKFIYFWEYFHRLWARTMGLVFFIPFLYFYRRRMLNSFLLKNLMIVVILAAVTASFGWIMVASGLIDRPWVNAYKLSFHLLLAITTLFWLTRTTVMYFLNSFHSNGNYSIKNKSLFYAFGLFLILQLFLGGMMSGMRAGMLFPTWPDMNGDFIPSLLWEPSSWVLNNFVDYDYTPFLGSLVQFVHRFMAYVLFFLGILLFYSIYSSNKAIPKSAYLFLLLLVTQVVLGILTVLFSKGTVPLLLGVLHQAFAILLVIAFTVLYLYLYYKPSCKQL